MSSGLARVALASYRWAGLAAYPLIGPYLMFRAAKGKEDRSRRLERFGFPSVDRPQGPLVWFHAASVGETNAVIPLIREMRRQNFRAPGKLRIGPALAIGVDHRRPVRMFGHPAVKSVEQVHGDRRFASTP